MEWDEVDFLKKPNKGPWIFVLALVLILGFIKGILFIHVPLIVIIPLGLSAACYAVSEFQLFEGLPSFTFWRHHWHFHH